MRLSTLPFIAIALTGCLTEGKLGEATFEYDCVADSDTGCDLFGSFPDALAVGSRFSVTARRTSGSPLVASPASSAKLVVENGQFVVQDAGRMSVLALEGSAVVDILDLQAQQIAELEVKPSFVQASFIPPLSISLTTSPTEIVVLPFGSSGTSLGGALDYTWEVAPAGVVDMVPEPGDNVASVTPIAAGTATITVRTGAAEGTLEVVVEAM